MEVVQNVYKILDGKYGVKKPHVRHMHKWGRNITTDCWKTACEDVKCIKLSHKNPITCFYEYGYSPMNSQQPRNFA